MGLAPEPVPVVQTPEPVPVVQTPEPVPVVQTPVSVPVEATPAELPRDLQNPVVVSPVVRLVFSPTPAINSADVDDEAMAAIGQRVVAEAPCVALEVVAEEQVFEAIDSMPVVPIAPVPQRGRAGFCGHRQHASCSYCPCSPERLGLVVCWSCSFCLQYDC